jgi:hypothetical protein
LDPRYPDNQELSDVSVDDRTWPGADGRYGADLDSGDAGEDPDEDPDEDHPSIFVKRPRAEEAEEQELRTKSRRVETVRTR